MKVIITGGRLYNDSDKIKEVLDFFKPTLIIHGDCAGADTLAKEYAIERGITHKPYPYPKSYGRAGGPIRNRQMCSENKDGLLIAFPGNNGTASCIREARNLGMEIYEVI